MGSTGLDTNFPKATWCLKNGLLFPWVALPPPPDCMPISSGNPTIFLSDEFPFPPAPPFGGRRGRGFRSPSAGGHGLWISTLHGPGDPAPGAKRRAVQAVREVAPSKRNVRHTFLLFFFFCFVLCVFVCLCVCWFCCLVLLLLFLFCVCVGGWVGGWVGAVVLNGTPGDYRF